MDKKGKKQFLGFTLACLALSAPASPNLRSSSIT